jgi:hypothetical protein
LDRHFQAGQQFLTCSARQFRFAEQLMPVQNLGVTIIVPLDRPDATLGGSGSFVLAGQKPRAYFIVVLGGVDQRDHKAVVIGPGQMHLGSAWRGGADRQFDEPFEITPAVVVVARLEEQPGFEFKPLCRHAL